MTKKRGAARDVLDVFLQELSKHGSIRKSCVVAGVSRSQVRSWRKDPTIEQLFQDSLDDSDDYVREKAVALATGRKPDPQMIKFLMQLKRDISDVQVNPTVNITIGK